MLYTNSLAVVYVTRKFDTSYTSKLVGIKNESKFVWVLHSHIHDIWHCLKVHVIRKIEISSTSEIQSDENSVFLVDELSVHW